MNTLSHQKLNSGLKTGVVYRREHLLDLSTAVDRDLDTLVDQGKLEKVAPGMYYKPKSSRFGTLPPDKDDLVKTFLKDKRYLMYSWNQYNSLGLGLTQLYTNTVVYNYKRHLKCKLGGQSFDFRRPTNGFPAKLSREFLLVDLLNNLKYLAEDSAAVRAAVKRNFRKFDKDSVYKMAKRYGKVATKKFFKDL